MEKTKLRRINKTNINDSESSKDIPSEKENSSTLQWDENSRKSTKRPGSPIEDDSLADFKSPKLYSRSILARNGVKFLDNPKNQKSTKSRSNPSRKAKKKSESNQMSIESSLFKPPTAFVCPLCLKTFNESSQQIGHSKNCAVRNKISTRQLIAATELHERQAGERVSIGLPATPIQQPKKKASTTKRIKTNNNNDPDIELAIALSKSLSEAQEIAEFDEAIVLAAESNEKLLEMSSSQRKSTLANFGFITNKPATEYIDKSKKRKMLGPTILQTRTEEVRNRLLTEKIAEAIVDNITETQKPVLEVSMSEGKDEETVNFRSEMLKEIYRPNCELWNGSVGEKSKEFYYVHNLCKFIKPVKKRKKVNNENKILTETNENITENKIENKDENNFRNSIDKEEDNPVDIQEKQDSGFNSYKNDENSCENEKSVEELENMSIDNEDGKSNENKLEEMSPLALSWSKLINSKVHSDVIIFVKNEKFIFGHFLVLWARCHELEKDLIINNADNDDCENKNEFNKKFAEKEQKFKMTWEDIDYQAGITFLEFIYCGCIINSTALKDYSILCDVKKLATKYKVEELMDFLQKLEFETKKPNIECQEMKEDNLSIGKNKENDISIEEDQIDMLGSAENNLTQKPKAEFPECAVQLSNEVDINVKNKETDKIDLNNIQTTGNVEETTIIIISEDESEMPEFQKSINKSYKNDLLRASYMSASPDIFDGMDSMILENSFERCQDNKNSKGQNEKNGDLESDMSFAETLDNEKETIGEKEPQINRKRYTNEDTINEELVREKSNTRVSYSENEETMQTNIEKITKDDNGEKLTENILKNRNNISLFIEKIQRRNGRFLESDTDEEDSVIMKPKNKKNPFKVVRTSDNDSGLLSKFRQKDLIRQEEENMKINGKIEKKSALSIFEDDIRAKFATEIKENIGNETNVVENGKFNYSRESSSGFNSDIEIVDEQWTEIEDNEKELKKNEEKMDEKIVTKFMENDSSFQSEDLIDSDEKNESMYTKYKKTHRKNSIDKYRSALKNYFDERLRKTSDEPNNKENSGDEKEDVENFEEFRHYSTQKSSENSSECSQKMEQSQRNNEIKEISNKSNPRNPRISLINQRNLTELSSFDFYEIEDEIQEENHENENSRENSQEVLNSSIDLTTSSDGEGFMEKNEAIEEKKRTEANVSLNNSQNISQNPEKIELNHQKLWNSVNVEENNMDLIENRKKSGITFDENLDSMDWNEEVFTEVDDNGPFTQSIYNDNPESEKNNKQDDFSLIVNSNWEMNPPPEPNWKNRIGNRENSFTQYMGTPTVTEDVTRILQECGILTSSFRKKDKSNTNIAEIMSPVVISSASDSDAGSEFDDIPDDFSFNFGDNNQDIYDDNQGNEKDEHHQSYDEMNFIQFEIEGGANNDFAEFSNVKSPVHLPLTSSTQNPSTSSAIPRLSQNSRRSTHSLSSDDENEKFEENSKSRRCSSVSPLKNDSRRLLEVKSQSEGNFSSARRSLGAAQICRKAKNSGKTRKIHKNEEICKFLGLTPSKTEISFQVPPKECYNQMSSPELKKRLTSFGLKNQERSRAVKLLNFIWDQMHPLVPENLLPENLSKNDATSNVHNGGKSKNLRKISEESSSESDHDKDENNRMHKMDFPEEMEFSDDDDDDDNDGKNDQGNGEENLKQNFEKLLEKDTVLYRKILMYEPICLNIFVEKLKESGFKVKPKILADFLNSECISFFIDAPKKWSGNIRKNKRK